MFADQKAKCIISHRIWSQSTIHFGSLYSFLSFIQ